ncbi:hypothetical protein C5B91_13585 [Haloferax sp. Atlit-10N]|uniref:hypothetical protein n=1 Tax=unclassified Haloferax TaxID=2625095 RepID=UPI000E289F52|nr:MULTISPECIES: hypothetical protein [unclassified Haloferax]RDZ43157.1 hypothetical protein C5B87_14415 [Haloferax sp. Atlit-16N]RDZ57731.1 hypothetical protein C5B91_13585 [Haloferax sp. Atlit-10N]
MQRRGVLASLGSLALLSGCLGGSDESSSETKTETKTATTTTANPETTESGQAATTTDECGWPQFCEGSELVRVRVSGGFSGEVVLKPACREDDVELSPGETETLTRQTDAETCDVTLLVDGEVAYDERIQDYEFVMLRVGSDGDLTLQKEEL